MSAMKTVKQWMTHPWLALVFRIYMAGLFIYAGMYKINYTAEFAETIATYRMVPYWAVNATAVTMPWIELICGILLFCGIRVRSSVTVAGSLLLVFTLGIAVNLFRASPISCGCFHSMGDAISWRTLVRDLVWVGMAIHIFLFDAVLRLERNIEALTMER